MGGQVRWLVLSLPPGRDRRSGGREGPVDSWLALYPVVLYPVSCTQWSEAKRGATRDRFDSSPDANPNGRLRVEWAPRVVSGV